jgi:hypothetical protein
MSERSTPRDVQDEWDTGTSSGASTGSYAGTSAGSYADERSGHDRAQEARRRRYGGLNAGAAFFGWLVALAVSVLLTGIIGAVLAAVGADIGITRDQAQRQGASIGLGAAVVLVLVLMVGYYAGGYVAGRMSRFHGSRQGLGVWVTGLVVSVLVIVLGAIFGQQYDVLSRVDLPRLPASAPAVGTTGVVAAMVVLVGTLLAALAGGSVGTHYHRRVDRAGW